MRATAPDPKALVELLDQTKDVLEQLVKSLDHEYLQLKTSAGSELAAVVAEKEASLSRLAKFDLMRQEFLDLHGSDRSKPTMEQLFQTFDADTATQLQARWNGVAVLTRETRRLNQRNGATINLSRSFVETMLAIWRGDDPSQRIYGPNAQPSPPSNTVRPIAEA